VISNNSKDFYERLEYPDIWVQGELCPAYIREGQEKLLAEEKPGIVEGSEHYRYAAFCYHTKNPSTSAATISLLLTAAFEDPDICMAQSAVLDLAAHSSFTSEMFERALSFINSPACEYVDESRLLISFREGKKSWEQ